MKWLLLLGVALLIFRSARRRRGDPPADGRSDFLIASAVLAAAGIAMLILALKVGLVGMAAGLAGLGMLTVFLALGLMKLRR
ncbi:hypothetical protein CLV97_11883 [Planifilum fimeticola]|jgi:hypothetical protein|uniref:Uncharacterized protein n=1 Tax=Planifilum fimeticola TaxID=201975 RepID=A0A2T0LD90_9BACL|nr:hypothetical protein [Planifilum fimeticola]PRX40002.1 hypothetical protein CLV97_11883 [Planifilum fimeticola]